MTLFCWTLAFSWLTKPVSIIHILNLDIGQSYPLILTSWQIQDRPQPQHQSIVWTCPIFVKKDIQMRYVSSLTERILTNKCFKIWLVRLRGRECFQSVGNIQNVKNIWVIPLHVFEYLCGWRDTATIFIFPTFRAQIGQFLIQQVYVGQYNIENDSIRLLWSVSV